MSDNGRCPCGCRIFFDLNTRITCSDGRAFDIPTVQISKCVSCELVCLIIGANGEKKTVKPFKSGKDAERELFLAALGYWKNDHNPERNRDFITISDEDKKDFERLGLKRDDPVMA